MSKIREWLNHPDIQNEAFVLTLILGMVACVGILFLEGVLTYVQ